MDDESILVYVRQRLPAPSDKEGLEAVAKGADVSYHTVLKIAKGETLDPRISTVENLWRYFRELEDSPKGPKKRSPSRAAA